ncbi:MAG TPA: nucleotidyltransferase [Hyphomonadaceae bacterium]|nr:nucleotidyltransferase [Hyphomonadaceae bacterium]
MKLVQHFTDFLNETVNLNETRLTQLDDSVEALKTFIRQSDWRPKIKGFEPQGSWAHRTIIRPVEGNPFDADLLALVAPVDGWDAKTYISELRRVFADSTTYKEKVRRFSHCVTIEYAAERKIDVAPCILDRGGFIRAEVCNFDANAFELSKPRRYTRWINERDAWAGSNGLRKTTRLVKYLRDIKTTFTCPSFLLTTLLGARINSLDSANTTDFADTPTALKTIFARLDDWLQQQNGVPPIVNPVLPSEVLSGVWTEAQFTNFRDKIHTYRGWIDDAYNEIDRDESIGKWRRVFGDEFASSVTVEKAANISTAARDYLDTTSLTPRAFDGDLVDFFARLGKNAIPPWFKSLPHKQRPKWRRAEKAVFGVTVSATLHDAKNGVWLTSLTGSDEPLAKYRWIQFQLRTSTGMPLGPDYEIHWRITNTDLAAHRAGCLRGGFEKANDGSSHWEKLEYRGIHCAEAFVVRKRDQALVAESEIFYVPIQ